MKTMIQQVLHLKQKARTPQQVIRKMRKLRGLKIVCASKLFGRSRCWIQHLEQGRSRLTQDKMYQLLQAYSFTEDDYKRLLCGEELDIETPRKVPFRPKKVVTNNQRRSYKKLIIKEVRVLKIMRKSLELTQDKASKQCKYSRPTIGHIEQGRIEIPLARIEHIVSCYGFTMDDFLTLLNSEVLRDEVLEDCHNLIANLSEGKLRVVQNLLKNF